MKVIQANINEFSKSMNYYFDKLTNNSEILVLNTENENGFVVMTLAQYNSINATNFELNEKTNVNRLNEAIKKINNGQTFEKELFLDEV